MFNEFLTTEGERLLAKAVAGTATISFTKMELGGGLQDTTVSKNIISLKDKVMTLDIYSVAMTGDNCICITSILDSKAIPNRFEMKEKGIWASDGTSEILFMYGTTSTPETMENLDNSVFQRTIRTVIGLSDSDHISIHLQNGVYASEEGMKNVQDNILTAIANFKGDWATLQQADSILSILDNLCKAYTVARAGKLDKLDMLDELDKLDVEVSSRAPASTALNTGIWTNARAGYLDYLPAIADRGMETDIVGKDFYYEEFVNDEEVLKEVKRFTNPKGGMFRVYVPFALSVHHTLVITIDGKTYTCNLGADVSSDNFTFDAPFENSFSLSIMGFSGANKMKAHLFIYANK